MVRWKWENLIIQLKNDQKEWLNHKKIDVSAWPNQTIWTSVEWPKAGQEIFLQCDGFKKEEGGDITKVIPSYRKKSGVI